MAKRYEDMMVEKLMDALMPKADELSVDFILSFNVAKNQYTCRIKNTEGANDFSIYALQCVTQKNNASITFEFPESL